MNTDIWITVWSFPIYFSIYRFCHPRGWWGRRFALGIVQLALCCLAISRRIRGRRFSLIKRMDVILKGIRLEQIRIWSFAVGYLIRNKSCCKKAFSLNLLEPPSSFGNYKNFMSARVEMDFTKFSMLRFVQFTLILNSRDMDRLNIRWCELCGKELPIADRRFL